MWAGLPFGQAQAVLRLLLAQAEPALPLDLCKEPVLLFVPDSAPFLAPAPVPLLAPAPEPLPGPTGMPLFTA